MARFREIGAAFVRLFVKDDELSAGLKDARQDVSRAADQMEQDAKRAGGAFGAAGTRIEKATEGARKFTGALSSTIGIVTAITGGIGVAAAGITGIVALANKFRDSMAASKDEVSDVVTIIRELRREVAELRGEESQGGPSPAAQASRDAAAARRNLRELVREADTLRKQIRALSIDPLDELSDQFRLQGLRERLVKVEEQVSLARVASAQLEEKSRLQAAKERIVEEERFRAELREQNESEAARRLAQSQAAFEFRSKFAELLETTVLDPLKQYADEAGERRRQEAEERDRREAAARKAHIDALNRAAEETRKARETIERNTQLNGGAFGFNAEAVNEIVDAINRRL